MQKILLLAVTTVLLTSAVQAAPSAGEVCANGNESVRDKNGAWLVCTSGEPVWTVMKGPDQVGAACRREGMISQAANSDILVCHGGKYQRAPEKKTVAQYDKLPTTGNTQGDVRMVLSIGRKVVWTGSTWDTVNTAAWEPCLPPPGTPPVVLDMCTRTPDGKIRTHSASPSTRK